jgi:hypothetical protein
MNDGASSSDTTLVPSDDEEVLDPGPQNVRAPARAAVCFVGAPRTFVREYVHGSILAAFGPAVGVVDFFFWLGEESGQGAVNSKGGSYEAYLDRDLRAAVERFSPVSVQYNGSTRFRLNPRCALSRASAFNYDRTNQSVVARQWETMAKMKLCYEDVVKEEVRRGALYDTIVRIRPDLAFTRPLNLTQVLQPRHPSFPRCQAGCKRPCTNDHMAFMPRAAASVYFTMSDAYMYCDGTLGMSTEIHEIPHLIFRSLQSRIYEVNVSYALVRNEGPDCERAGRLDATTRRGYSTSECVACKTLFAREYGLFGGPLAVQACRVRW